MRKVGQTLCKKSAPRWLIHDRAVVKADGSESVASGWLHTATRVRETGAAKVEDVFGGETLACAALLPREAEEAWGFPRPRDAVIIPPKELERQDAELCGADKEGAQEEAMKAAQQVEDERFSAKRDMECSPEDDAEIAGASMAALTLPTAEEGEGTSAGLDTARGLALINPSADVPATEPRRPCAAQTYKEVSTRAAQVLAFLRARTELLVEKKDAQAIFQGARTNHGFFFRKGVSTPNDPPSGATSDAALRDWPAQEAKNNSTTRGNVEPSKPQSTGSWGSQQTHETREEARGDYAFGIIFSSLYDVGRHHTDLVVKGLIIIARRPKAWRTSLRVDLGKVVLDKLLRHWALYKRPVHLPLLGGLRLLQRKNLSVGLLLYAMMVCNETQPRTFTRGIVGEDGGGPDNNDKNEGPKNKRKRRARVDLRAGSGKSDTTKQGEQPRKRKTRAEAIGKGSRPSAPSALVHAALALTLCKTPHLVPRAR
jgi:hypothetical protein